MFKSNFEDLSSDSIQAAIKRLDSERLDTLLSLDETSRTYIEHLKRKISRPSVGSSGQSNQKTGEASKPVLVQSKPSSIYTKSIRENQKVGRGADRDSSSEQGSREILEGRILGLH